MRNASIDRKQVIVPNASHIGFGKNIAQFGDFIIFHDQTRDMAGRVAGRIDYAEPCGDSPAVRNWLLVVAINLRGEVMQRWVDPVDVLECYSPKDAGEWEKRQRTIEFLLSNTFMESPALELIQWTESGFCTAQEHKRYNERKRACG